MNASQRRRLQRCLAFVDMQLAATREVKTPDSVLRGLDVLIAMQQDGIDLDWHLSGALGSNFSIDRMQPPARTQRLN
jgi:hypothetical protein